VLKRLAYVVIITPWAVVLYTDYACIKKCRIFL